MCVAMMTIGMQLMTIAITMMTIAICMCVAHKCVTGCSYAAHVMCATHILLM